MAVYIGLGDNKWLLESLLLTKCVSSPIHTSHAFSFLAKLFIYVPLVKSCALLSALCSPLESRMTLQNGITCLTASLSWFCLPKTSYPVRMELC